MKAATSHSYNLTAIMSEGVYNNIDGNNQETFEELQARISMLESELKKQREVAEKGAKILKMMWGDTFETDSLH